MANNGDSGGDTLEKPEEQPEQPDNTPVPDDPDGKEEWKKLPMEKPLGKQKKVGARNGKPLPSPGPGTQLRGAPWTQTMWIGLRQLHRPGCHASLCNRILAEWNDS